MKLRIAVLVAHILISVLYCIATPILEKNDEESHAWFIRHLTAGGDLPVQQPGQPDSDIWREASQPPLYYWLAALVFQQFDLSDFDQQLRPNQSPSFNPYAPNNKNLLIITPEKRAFAYQNTTLAVFIMRLLGIPLSALTVWLVYSIAYTVSRDRWLALLAMGITAFNPMFMQVMTALGNDGLVIAMATAGLAAITRAVLDGLTVRRVVGIGLLIGLAGISKVGGTLLLLVVAAAIVCRELLVPSAASSRRRLVLVTLRGLAVLALWAMVAGWWYVRNQMLYGDFTGTSVMAVMMTPRDISIWQALSEWHGFKMSYIALFGRFTVPANGIVYIAFDVLLAMCAIGWIFIGVRLVSASRMGRVREGGEDIALSSETPEHRKLRMLGIGLLALYVALLLISLLRWTMMTPASQGRLIFPGITGVSTLLAIGLFEWRTVLLALAARLSVPFRLGRAGQVITSVVVLPFALLALVSPFRYIIPSYVPPLVSEIPAGMMPVYQRMGNLAEITAYDMAPDYAQPGDKVRVRVLTRALRQEPANYSLVVKLYGRDNQLLARYDTFTGNGLYPTELWRAGDMMLDTVEFTLPDNVDAPATLHAQFELYNRGSGDIMTSMDVAGNVGAPLYAGATLLPDLTQSDPLPALATFGDLAHLTGYTVTEVMAGQSLTVTIDWQTIQRAPNDYAIFVHLLDADGNAVAQHDQQPLRGQFPTSRWKGGISYTDRHVLQVPQHTPPGSYSLAIGFYDPVDGARLPVALADAADGSLSTRDSALVIAGLQPR